MMHPVSWNMARLLRRIRRRDMKIGKLKRELRKLRRRQHKMEEERKAVITVQQDKNIIDVSIAVFPGATSVGKCGDLAWIGFRAIKEELAKMPVNINDGVGKII